jgi:hypothetical protein
LAASIRPIFFPPFHVFFFERSTVGVYLFLLQLSIPPFSQWADDTHFKKKSRLALYYVSLHQNMCNARHTHTLEARGS